MQSLIIINCSLCQVSSLVSSAKGLHLVFLMLAHRRNFLDKPRGYFPPLCTCCVLQMPSMFNDASIRILILGKNHVQAQCKLCFACLFPLSSTKVNSSHLERCLAKVTRFCGFCTVTSKRATRMAQIPPRVSSCPAAAPVKIHIASTCCTPTLRLIIATLDW